MWYVATVTSLSRVFFWERIIWIRIYYLPLCFLSWTLSISSNSTMIQLHEFDVSKGSTYNQSFEVQEFKSSKPIFNEKQSIFLVHILRLVCCTHWLPHTVISKFYRGQLYYFSDVEQKCNIFSTGVRGQPWNNWNLNNYFGLNFCLSFCMHYLRTYVIFHVSSHW